MAMANDKWRIINIKSIENVSWCSGYTYLKGHVLFDKDITMYHHDNPWNMVGWIIVFKAGARVCLLSDTTIGSSYMVLERQIGLADCHN